MTAGAERELPLRAMQMLLCGDTQSLQAAQAIAASGQWGELVDLCATWKLLPALESRIAQLRCQVPADECAELGRRTALAFVQSTLCVRAGIAALSALDRAQIRCAGFKGLATLAYLYPGPRSRTLQDVDVLIHPCDVEAAMTALEDTGFQRFPDIPWSEYLAFVRASPGSAGNEAVSLRDAQGGAVDLHWRLGGLDVEALLAEICRVEMFGTPVPLIPPGRSMLLSVHHALRNDFVPRDIARDVCDFAQWQVLLGKLKEWDRLRADAERWGLSAAYAAMVEIVAEFQGARMGLASPPVSRMDSEMGRRIAGLYSYQLRDRSINTDLTYLLSPGSMWQVLSGLAGGWKDYVGAMRRLEAMNGEPSLHIGGRVWQLAKSVARVSPLRWRQIRALASAKGAMSAPR
jgi:hypothetical protein